MGLYGTPFNLTTREGLIYDQLINRTVFSTNYPDSIESLPVMHRKPFFTKKVVEIPDNLRHKIYGLYNRRINLCLQIQSLTQRINCFVFAYVF